MRRVVGKTAEWRRIDALPRADWPEVDLTHLLRRPGGTQRLWRTQSVALYYARQLGGLVGAIGVGEGKSVLSLLIPVALSAQRPLLLVPAALRDQTVRKVIPQMRKHWILHPYLRILSYTELSRTGVELGTPDVIVCDEAHELRNFRAARGRRFWEYLKKHPATRVTLLSGTLTRDSLLDYYHLSGIALGGGSPLPRSYPEALLWDLAISPVRSDRELVDPGALCHWHADPRRGLQRRLAETPGFVISQKSECGASIVIRLQRQKMPKIAAAVAACEAAWVAPDDRELWDGLAVYQCTAQLSQGFYYRLIERPPREWVDARREYVRAVREHLRYRRTVHSELEYRLSVESPEKTRWLAVRSQYRLQTETVWYSDELIDWALDQEGPTIVWAGHRAFGARLAERIPYYAAGDSGVLDETGKRTVGASLRGHGTGKNLQQFSRLAVPLMVGGDWEQLIGRCHRAGQRADTVTVDVCLATSVAERAWTRALARARYQAETLGTSRRLLSATIVEDAVK